MDQRNDRIDEFEMQRKLTSITNNPLEGIMEINANNSQMSGDPNELSP